MESLSSFWDASLESLSTLWRTYVVSHPVAVAVTILCAATVLLVWSCRRRPKFKEMSQHTPDGGNSTPQPQGRIRKRDIVGYYGKRMIRKARRDIGLFRRKPSEKVLSIAKRFLQGPEIPERQLYREPPAAFLEADYRYLEGDTNVPSEVLYLLKSVRVFGHFEKPLFMELCKHVETKFVPSGAILFRPGMTDDSIYVVRNGRLKVYILEQDGSELPLKEAGTGDSIHSMLSVLDAVTGHPRPFRSVAARAIRDSYVLQVKAKAFVGFFEDNPDSLLRMVQIIALRLQRVTFLALNQFLGLSRELLNQKPSLQRELSVSKLKQRPVKLLATSYGEYSYGSDARAAENSFDSDCDQLPPFPPLPQSNPLLSDEDDCSSGSPRKLSGGTRKVRPSRSDTTRQTGGADGGAGVLRQRAGTEPSGSVEKPGGGILSAMRNQGLSASDSRLDCPVAESDAVTSDDSRGNPAAVKKSVAIDTTQNKHFTHRLLPIQSPEFDNVINQARVDRQEFSSEGFYLDTQSAAHTGSSLSSGGGGESATPTNPTSSASSPSKAAPGYKRSTLLKFSHFATMECGEVLQAATEDLVKIFQLEDEALLKGRIQLIEVPANSVLGLEGDLESCIYFIASGRLKVFRHTGDAAKDDTKSSQDLLYVAYPGEFCGALSALTGEPSFITIKAAMDAHLIAITKTNLYHIMSEQPKAVCGLAYDLVQRLSPIVRQMDFALDWMELEAGRPLYRQGDEANAAYIILNGRVRSVVKRVDGKKELVDEFGRGEAIGVVEVMTNSTCATTVHAIRDTELACLPSGLLSTIKLKQPQVVSRLIQVLGEKILGSYNRLSSIPAGSFTNSLASREMKKHMVSNLSTVAVVSMTKDVPLSYFTKELCSAVSTIAPALRLTSHQVQEELGSSALESVHEYRLRTWLAHQEDNHRIVFYQADGADVTPWTARCIRQADCILLVGLAENLPSQSMGQIVKQVESISIRVQKELVLLHREGVAHPTGTVKWLNVLGWLSSYFHVRCPEYFFASRKRNRAENNSLPPPPSKHSDFARLARRLTGTSVGLVLGGGGARGLSHVGALKAFAESGVPIDMVAGTSMGAFVGALYCEERDAERVEARTRKWARGMAGYSDKVWDLTYPTTSMFTGRGFNHLTHQIFGEKQIEDLWLPYYCVTTDITESKMRVHSSGSLWRYVRASMSLSGYMPPLCDPVDGHLLLDGGYVNNLPADVLMGQGAETIIAVDVGAEDNNDLTNYGDHISGWYLLWKKLNPFGKRIRVPNLTEIQSRLAYVSCMRQLEAVKSSDMVEYIRPPIDNIHTLQFSSFESIVVLGHKHCQTVVGGWQKSHTMRHLLSGPNEEEKEKNRRQHFLEQFEQSTTMKARSSSVRDLVALAAQIPRQKPPYSDEGGGEDSNDSNVAGYCSNPEGGMFPGEDDGEESPLSDSMSPMSVPKFTTWSDSELP